MNTPVSLPGLSILGERLAVCRLDADSGIPSWATSSGFTSFTRTMDELSVVCMEGSVPEGEICEKGWRVFKLKGPLDFSLIGVLGRITWILAEADISVFVISTYNTDYVLVREKALGRATSALRRAGHEVRETNTNMVIRVATVDDEPFLWDMLYEAVHWEAQSSPKPSPDELLAEPGLRRYLTNWGKPGDFAVVMEDVDDGSRLGAAWHRLFPASDPGYGFVDEATPEIAIAVAPDWRGAGTGVELLAALMNAARSGGFDALSLGVQKSNHAATKLYGKSGFVKFRDDGRAWIMKADLTSDQTTNYAQQKEERCR